MPAHIVKRVGIKGITWTARFPTGERTEAGTPKLLCKTFKFKREAEEHLEDLKAVKKEGGPVRECEQRLSTFFSEYLEALDVREVTRTSYQVNR